MLIDFFYLLKEAGLPVSTTEYLALLEAWTSASSPPASMTSTISRAPC